MQLVKGGTTHQPVTLLVEREEDLLVCEKLVQTLAGVESRVVREAQRQQTNRAKFLNLSPGNMNRRLTVELGGISRYSRGRVRAQIGLGLCGDRHGFSPRGRILVDPYRAPQI